MNPEHAQLVLYRSVYSTVTPLDSIMKHSDQDVTKDTDTHMS